MAQMRPHLVAEVGIAERAPCDITAREGTFGSWNRRRLQLALTTCVAALAVAVAVGSQPASLDSAPSLGRDVALAPVVTYHPPATTFYLAIIRVGCRLLSSLSNPILPC